MIWMNAMSAPPFGWSRRFVSPPVPALHRRTVAASCAHARRHEIGAHAGVEAVDVGVVEVAGDADHLAPLREDPGAPVAAAEVPLDACPLVVRDRALEVLGDQLDEVFATHRPAPAPPAHRSAPIR